MCSETSGRECQNFGGRARETRRRAPGTEGRTYDSAGRRARGSALPLLLRPGPRGRQPGLPVHMPPRRGGRERRAGAAALGGGTPPAVGRAVGRDSRPPRVRALPRAAVAGGELGSGRAAPSAGPGRSLHSALWPRRAAGSRPSAVLRSDSRASAPARPALPLRDPRLGSVPSHGLGGWSRRPRLRPGLTAPGPGFQDPHLTQFSSKPGLGAGRSLPVACCCEPTPQPQRRKREGDRERAGVGGGGRVGRWRRREGQRVPSSSLRPGPSRQQQLETSAAQGRARVPGRRTRVEVGEGMERMEERGGFLSFLLPRYEVIPGDLRSLEQDPRSCRSNSQPSNPSRQIIWTSKPCFRTSLRNMIPPAAGRLPNVADHSPALSFCTLSSPFIFSLTCLILWGRGGWINLNQCTY